MRSLPEWYPDQELNLDPSFRKRLLYPFELSGQTVVFQWFTTKIGGLDTPNA